MAYLDVVLSIHGEPLKRTSIFTHFLNCEDAAKQKTPGMFARWPTGSLQTQRDGMAKDAKDAGDAWDEADKAAQRPPSAS